MPRESAVPASWLRALLLLLIVLTWLVLLVLGVWLLSHFTKTILLVTLAAILAFAFTPLANFFGRDSLHRFRDVFQIALIGNAEFDFIPDVREQRPGIVVDCGA